MKYITVALCLLLPIASSQAAPNAPAPTKSSIPSAHMASLPPAQAKAVTAKPAPPDAVVPLLRAMLLDYRRYAEAQWHADAVHPNEGYWGSGRADGGNEGLRAISINALVYALLAKNGDTPSATADRVGPALRYAAATYLTGTHPGTDNKKWGNSWQSAMWTGNLGAAAWLAKDSLDADTLAAVKRVVAAEADRFVTGAASGVPPTMAPGDTKAEENAWDLTAPAAAVLLMPEHPHAAAWHTAVLTYGFNTISREQDKTSTVPADGKTVGDWVTTTQVFPDFTLENHDIFHPVYSMIGPATNAQAGVDYRLGGKPVPDALTFNVLNQWQMLQYIALPDGEWLYPQGLDWDLHDYEHIHYWTMLATLFQNPAAALLEQRTLGYARRRQQINGDGSFVGPSGSLGFAREAVQAERVAFALLMHQQFGAPPAASASDWGALAGHLEAARVFPYVGMVIHHAPRGMTSFSWKNHLMAQIVPQSLTHLDQPYVTTPNAETLVGAFTLQGQRSTAFHVNSQAVQTTADGFTATVDAGTGSNSLRQQIAISSVAPGVVAYVDRVTALKAVTVTEERGLLLGIENDEVSGNQRRLQTSASPVTVHGGQAQDYPITGHWANVDDRLGLVSAFDAPLLYRAVGKPNRAGAREDYLMGSYRSSPRAFAAGDVVSVRAGLILLDATAADTAKAAAGLTAQNVGNTLTLSFVAPDDRHHTLDLPSEGTAHWDGQEIKAPAR